MSERLDPLHLQEQLRACKERALLDRLRPRFWFARLVIALEVLIVTLVAVTWFEEASLTAQAIEATGRFGWLLIVGTWYEIDRRP